MVLHVYVCTFLNDCRVIMVDTSQIILFEKHESDNTIFLSQYLFVDWIALCWLWSSPYFWWFGVENFISITEASKYILSLQNQHMGWPCWLSLSQPLSCLLPLFAIKASSFFLHMSCLIGCNARSIYTFILESGYKFFLFILV